MDLHGIVSLCPETWPMIHQLQEITVFYIFSGMKIFQAIVLLLLLSPAWGQELDTLNADSLTHNYFSLAPGLQKNKISASGNSIIGMNGTLSFQTNTGISVFNSLRGNVPNFSISPYFTITTVGWRSSTPLLVVDGLPYAQGIFNSCNFNGSEFSSIDLLMSGNAAIIFGGNAAGGAIVLHTKSGKGVSRPTVEFNSYTTNSWRKSDVFNVSNMRDSIIQRTDSLGNTYADTVSFFEGTYSKKRLDQWLLSNTLAYSQDFGKADVRVSVNNVQQPNGDNSPKGQTLYNFKINSGLELNKFNARLILDKNFSSLDYITYTLGRPWVDTTSQALKGHIHNDFLQGNLVLKYDILDWISISTQLAQSRIVSEDKIESLSNKKTTSERQFANSILSVSKEFVRNLSTSFYAGFQYDNNTWRYRGSNQTSNLSTEKEFDTKAIIAGLDIGYKKFAFINGTLRSEKLSYISFTDDQISYALSGAFIFSDAFNLVGNVLSFGKVRGSFGKNQISGGNSFPFSRSTTNILNSLLTQPLASYSQNQSIEAGIDVTLFKNKITLTYNYFNILQSRLGSSVPVDPSTGFSSMFINLGDVRTKGSEVMASANVYKNKNWDFTTSLVWGMMDFEIEEQSGGSWPVTIPGFPSGGWYTPTQSIGNPNPDWTGSWLNRLTFKKFNLGILCDFVKGGDFYSGTSGSINRGPFILPGVIQWDGQINAGDYNSDNYVVSIEDGSFAKLREITLGYQLPARWWRNGFVSITARNLAMIYSKSGEDPEEGTPATPYIKSMSLNLNLTF